MLQLQASSSGPAPEILLTDTLLERALVLRLLLDLACGRLFKDFDNLNCFEVLDLISLAEKYDCEAVLSIVSLYSRRLDADADSHRNFYYACRLDDLQTAHHLLPRAAKYSWVGDDGLGAKSVNGRPAMSCTMDVTVMPVEWQDRLPRKYFHALLRATRLRLEGKVDWEVVADEFKAQVEQQSKSMRIIRYAGNVNRADLEEKEAKAKSKSKAKKPRT
jgi:hypothetical protein